MGIQTIMSAHMILIIVSSREKAEAVRQSFFGPITPHVPASILQLHSNVIAIADEDALSLS